VKTTEPADFVQVRKNIATLVGGAAEAIATEAIEMAKAGQLAPAKYFFEAVGLYPPTAETTAGPEDSLAYTLLKRMGLPTDPLIRDEEVTPGLLVNDVKQATSEPADAEEGEVRSGEFDASEAREHAAQQNKGREDAVK
jgi:hypothetical protein